MIACIDIGGTHTRVALSKDGKTFFAKNVFDTPVQPEDAMTTIIQSIEVVAHKEKVERVVIGVPGILTANSVIVSSVNLKKWQGFNVVTEFKKVYGVEPVVVNDAVLGALGEATHGAGASYERVGYITVSTGIGGALICNKHIAEGVGFEPGKQIIDVGGMKTLEDFASGAGVQKETHKNPRETTDPAFWEEKARVLAIGLWNTIVDWSPDILVIGGPMVLGSPKIDIESVKKYIKEIARDGFVVPVIVRAMLGDDAGLYGALEIAKR